MNVKDIVQVDYKTYYSDEFMFEFSKWINSKYIRLSKGWLTTEDNTSRELFTTKELLEEFKKSKDETIK